MSKKKNLIVLVLVFVLLIGGASVLYTQLSKNDAPDRLLIHGKQNKNDNESQSSGTGDTEEKLTNDKTIKQDGRNLIIRLLDNWDNISESYKVVFTDLISAAGFYPYLNKLDLPIGDLDEEIRMEYHMSFFSLKNYADEYLAALEKSGKKVEVVADDAEVVEKTAADIIEGTKDYILKELSKNLKGYDLEDFVANLLEAMGYRAEVSQHGGDSGIDITAYKDELPPRILVQVKSSDSDIRESTIQSLKGAMREGDYGLFITLANYTKNAQNFALIGRKDFENIFESRKKPRFAVCIENEEILIKIKRKGWIYEYYIDPTDDENYRIRRHKPQQKSSV